MIKVAVCKTTRPEVFHYGDVVNLSVIICMQGTLTRCTMVRAVNIKYCISAAGYYLLSWLVCYYVPLYIVVLE